MSRPNNRKGSRWKKPQKSGDGPSIPAEAPLPSSSDTSSLLVIGLPRGVRPGKLRKPLRDFFKDFGLKKLRVASTHTGHCRGYGIADLERPSDALQAAIDAGGIQISLESGASSTATLSPCCGGKIDSLFPFVPESIRQQIQLDPESMYSTTDQALGVHIAVALQALCVAGGGDPDKLGVVDGCGCCGGSALMLLDSFGGPVRVVEFNEERSKLLTANLALLSPDGRASCKNGNFLKLWPELSAGAGVIFLDVPWGGPSYGEQKVIDSLALGGVDLVDLINRLATSEAAPLVVLRLPRNMNMDKMAKELSSLWDNCEFRWNPELRQPERHMPFSFELGHCGIIFAICMCKKQTDASPEVSHDKLLSDGFRLHQLDDLVGALQSWDGERGHRHRASFFDWECKRWIPLSRWKGCKAGLRETATAEHAAIEQEAVH